MPPAFCLYHTYSGLTAPLTSTVIEPSVPPLQLTLVIVGGILIRLISFGTSTDVLETQPFWSVTVIIYSPLTLNGVSGSSSGLVIVKLVGPETLYRYVYVPLVNGEPPEGKVVNSNLRLLFSQSTEPATTPIANFISSAFLISSVL